VFQEDQMILVRHQESSHRLRNGMATVPLLAAFVMLASLEVSGSSFEVHWIPLLYIPAVIATAWFLGWRHFRGGCALLVKLNGGLNRVSRRCQHDAVEAAVRQWNTEPHDAHFDVAGAAEARRVRAIRSPGSPIGKR
jgi:hypothetical protein